MELHGQGGWNEHEAGEQGYEDCSLCSPVEGSQKRSETGGEWREEETQDGYVQYRLHSADDPDEVEEAHALPVSLVVFIARDAEERARAGMYDPDEVRTILLRREAAEERATQAEGQRARALSNAEMALSMMSSPAAAEDYLKRVIRALNPSTEDTPSEEK